MILQQQDTPRHKGMRERLIGELREKGIKDEGVLRAMQKIPRHFFLDSAFDNIAYEDRAFPIEADQTISQPYTVAYQSALLEIKPLEKVLEIGTGSAYQATVLAELGAFVFTIERIKTLFMVREKRYPFASQYKVKIKFFYGDGFEGLPQFAPFDKILITAAAPEIPPKLLAQLKPGGLMVLPLDKPEGNKQVMLRIRKINDTEYETETFEDFSFVPMLKGRD
ncbi:MAG: protein-L-isoaspartate(D-aspartate) O-methyltransferase [Chitinophagaceae bacterium]